MSKVIRLTSKKGKFAHIKQAMDAGVGVYYCDLKVVAYSKNGRIKTEGNSRFFIPWIPAIKIIA